MIHAFILEFCQKDPTKGHSLKLHENYIWTDLRQLCYVKQVLFYRFCLCASQSLSVCQTVRAKTENLLIRKYRKFVETDWLALVIRFW